MLPGRAQAQGPHEDPGVSRRPARDRHHRRRRGLEWAQIRRQADRERRRLGRRCGHARLPRPARQLPLRRENVVISDAKGVVYAGRKEGMDPDKERYARDTSARSLGDIMPGTCSSASSAGGVVKPEMVKAMAEKPLILALANPEPEIRPEAVKQVRSDALIFTGDRITRTRSTTYSAFRSSSAARSMSAPPINEPMKIAAVHAIADLAHAKCPMSWPAPTAAKACALVPSTRSQPLRPAPHRAYRSGGRAGGYGQRGRNPAARRY